jgi:hypothetical protein
MEGNKSMQKTEIKEVGRKKTEPIIEADSFGKLEDAFQTIRDEFRAHSVRKGSNLDYLELKSKYSSLEKTCEDQKSKISSLQKNVKKMQLELYHKTKLLEDLQETLIATVNHNPEEETKSGEHDARKEKVKKQISQELLDQIKLKETELKNTHDFIINKSDFILLNKRPIQNDYQLKEFLKEGMSILYFSF